MTLFYPTLHISRATWGADWPLTVEEGTLQLRTSNRVVFLAIPLAYAVNGAAAAEKHFALDRPRYKPISWILAEGQSVGKLIEVGLQLATKGN